MKLFSLFILAILYAIPSSSQGAPLWMRYPAISPDGKTIVVQGSYERFIRAGTRFKELG